MKMLVFFSSFHNVFIVTDIILDVLEIQYVEFVMRLFIHMKSINSKKLMFAKMFVFDQDFSIDENLSFSLQ